MEVCVKALQSWQQLEVIPPVDVPQTQNSDDLLLSELLWCPPILCYQTTVLHF